MQRLSKKFHNVAAESGFFESWKQRNEAKKKKEVYKDVSNFEDIEVMIAVGGFVGGCLLGGLIVGAIANSVHVGLLFSLFAFVSTALMFCWVQFYKKPVTIDLAETKLVRVRASDPLYQRAMLILRALHDYNSHVENYKILCDQIDDEDIKEDAGKMNRYYNLLEKAEIVLSNAIANFKAVVERVSREEKYFSQHPGESRTDGSQLALLLGELVDKTKLPKDLLQTDPLASLEHQESLEAAVSDLQASVLPVVVQEA